MTTLYDIQKGLFAKLTEASDPELSEVERVRLKHELDSLYHDRDLKLKGCYGYLKHLETDETAYAEEVKRLRAKKDSIERRREWLKDYVTACLYGSPWENGTCGFSFRKSKETVPDTEEAKSNTPDAYCRIKVVKEPDKVLIKRTIESGGSVPGWHVEDKLNLQLK